MKSKFSAVLPLIIVLLLVTVAAFVGFVVYTIVTSVQDETNRKMQKHNVTLSREGMKVGVKEVNAESYTDQTQHVLMKVWNHAKWPAYKSRLGWGQAKEQQDTRATLKKKAPAPDGRSSTPSAPAGAGTEHRKPYSRNGSSQHSVPR